MIKLKGMSSARIAKNMTQLELAKILNVSRITINRYEQGKQWPPSTTLDLIADALDVTVTDLLTGGDDDERI